MQQTRNVLAVKPCGQSPIKRLFINTKFVYLPKPLPSDEWTQVKSKEVIIKELFGPQQVPNAMPELSPNGSKSAAILK